VGGLEGVGLSAMHVLAALGVSTSQSINGKQKLQDTTPHPSCLEFNGTRLGTENGVWQR
jgi:hypothetical protein